MSDVFISYSRKDTDFVRRLFDYLKMRNRKAWVDWQGIDYSTRWWEEICSGIDGADNFILIVSPDALNSIYCHREIEHARLHHKRIIPFVYRPLNEKELIGGWYTLSEMRPYEVMARDNWEIIKSIQWIDYPNKLNSDFDRAVDVLLATVDTDPQRVRLHTRLLLRIRDWEGRGRSPSALLRGDELAAYETWLKQTEAVGDEPHATDGQRGYIAESRRVEEEERRAEERRKQELNEAAKRAEEERQKAEAAAGQAKRLRRLAAIAGTVAFIIIIVAVLTAFDARGQTATANQARAGAETQIADASTQIAEQQAIAPGATRGVELMSVISGLSTSMPIEIVAIYLPGWQPIQQNRGWIPVIRVFNGVEMVLVPAGCFDMGTNDPGSRSIEQPVHHQCIETPYWIDRYEVTNAQFDALNGITAKSSQWTDQNRPRENINWFEARDFCMQRQVRLPTEVEWEYAARGPDGLRYSWGNDFDDQYVPLDNKQTYNVGSIAGDLSWVGAIDMSGNVSEWVSSIYQGYPYQANTQHEDLSNPDASRVARGGSYWAEVGNNYAFTMLAAIRSYSRAEGYFANRGFRCARSY